MPTTVDQRRPALERRFSVLLPTALLGAPRLRRPLGAAAARVALAGTRMLALTGASRFRPDPLPSDEIPRRWRGTGPLVLVGGFGATPIVLESLRRWLQRLGYTVVTHTAGAGMGCAGRSVTALRATLREVAGDGAVPVVAHSRGGQFARVVAASEPSPVSALVTLGSGFELWGLRSTGLFEAALAVAAGTLGAPGMLSLRCLRGACCAEFRTGLRAPVRAPFTVVYSRADRTVSWQACPDPSAVNVEVTGSHLGLLVDRPAMYAVAEALAGAGQAA